MLSLEDSLTNPVAVYGSCRVDNDFFRIPFVHTSAYVPDDDPRIIELYEKCDRGEIAQSECDRIYDYLAAITMIISDEACGYYHRLIITGAARGQIWGDGEVSDRGYLPLNIVFLDWLESK